MRDTITGQKRRVLFFGGCMAVGLWLLGILPARGVIDSMLSIVIGFAVMITAAIAVIWVRPQNRGWLDCIAIGTALGSISGILSPYDGLVGLPLAIIVSAGLIIILHEEWKNKLSLRLSVSLKGGGDIDASTGEVYEALVPGKGQELVSQRWFALEPEPEDASVFYAGHRSCGPINDEAIIRISDFDPPDLAVMDIEIEDDDGRITKSQLQIKTKAFDAVSCSLELRELLQNVHPGVALTRFFDDPLGGEYRWLCKYFKTRAIPEPEEVPPMARPQASERREDPRKAS